MSDPQNSGVPAGVTLGTPVQKDTPVNAIPAPSAGVPAGVTLGTPVQSDTPVSQIKSPVNPSSDEGILHKALLGANTAAGTPTPPQIQNETSGLGDILQGNIRQGLSKVWDSEQPHVIPGSPIERAIQVVSPGFHGAGGPAPERALAHPIVDAAQFIDKKEHPMAKAVAEAAQSMTSPDAVAVMAATGGLGMVESPQALGVANRLLSAGFAASTVGNAYQHLGKFKEAYDKGDKDEAEYQLTHAVLSGTISALAAGHAATGEQLPFASEREKAVGRAVASVSGKVAEGVKDTAGKIKEKVYPTLPEAPAEIPMTPKPAVPHVEINSPLDDVAIRKLGGKNLSADARDTLREHVGGDPNEEVLAGDSHENALLKAVKPTNDTIAAKGAELDGILNKASNFAESAHEDVTTALSKLVDDLPGGTEETFGKAISKEVARYRDQLDSVNPKEINNTIRSLDQRIKSYNAPEEPLETPENARDAARVTIRRVLRDKLNTELPDTAPINAELGKNLEVRAFLRKKFGDVADDSAAAEAQHASEFQKGKTYLEKEQLRAAQNAVHSADVAEAQKTRGTTRRVGKIAATTAMGTVLGGPVGTLSGLGAGILLDKAMSDK